MNSEKQIEGMAMILCGFDDLEHCATCSFHNGCAAEEDAKELYAKGYCRASDVAEEIFAEIEKMLLNNHIGHYKTVKDTWCYNFNDEIISEIAELKKKYESEKDDG